MFAREGAATIIVDVRPEVAESAASEIRNAGGSAMAIPGDASDIADVNGAVRLIIEKYGRIDVLVNNAGLFSNSPALALTVADWHRVLAVNLDSVFFWSLAAVREIMMPARAGVIVNVASLAALAAGPDSSAYTAAKHGVVGLTKALAVEWAPFGIRVNALCPGLTQTEMVQSGWLGKEEALARRLARIPSGKIAQPDDQANAILFMASVDAAAVNGLVMNVDGGQMALSSGYSIAGR
jgi:NAD(P)-dependent dehydrogenase (short-subunit alcohol dehydrogenase family)